jgi:carbon-monoxide dehydrogenase medium subunit
VIPAPFAYAAPEDLDEVIQLLMDGDDEARLLAGGHSLVPVMKLRLARPSLLIDLRKLRGQLAYVRADEESVAIGALTTHAEIEHDPLLAEQLPVLGATARRIGDRLVRSRGTIGGSLCHVDPAADWTAVALALGARVTAVGPAGERSFPVEELFIGPYTNSLQPGEVLVEIRFPRHTETGSAYLKQPRQGESDFAVVGCCATLSGTRCHRVRVAFTGLAAVPETDAAVQEALTGQKPTQDKIDAAAALAGDQSEPLEDAFGSSGYRRHLARMLARRALTEAASQIVSPA